MSVSQLASTLWIIAEELIQAGEVVPAIKALDCARCLVGLPFDLKAKTLTRLAAIFLDHVLPLHEFDFHSVLVAKSFTEQALVLLKRFKGNSDVLLQLHAQRVNELLLLQSHSGHQVSLETALQESIKYSTDENRWEWKFYFYSLWFRRQVKCDLKTAFAQLDSFLTSHEAFFDNHRTSKYSSLVLVCEIWFRLLYLEMQIRSCSNDSDIVSEIRHVEKLLIAADERREPAAPASSSSSNTEQCLGCIESGDLVVLHLTFSSLATVYWSRIGQSSRASASLEQMHAWMGVQGEECATMRVPGEFRLVMSIVFSFLAAVISPSNCIRYVENGLSLLSSKSLSSFPSVFQSFLKTFKIMLLQLRAMSELHCAIPECSSTLAEVVALGGGEDVTSKLLTALLAHVKGDTMGGIDLLESLLHSLPEEGDVAIDGVGVGVGVGVGSRSDGELKEHNRCRVTILLHLFALLLQSPSLAIVRQRTDSVVNELRKLLAVFEGEREGESSRNYGRSPYAREIAVFLFLLSQLYDGDIAARYLRDSLKISREPLKDKRLISLLLLHTASSLAPNLSQEMRRELLTSSYRLARHSHDIFVQMSSLSVLQTIILQESLDKSGSDDEGEMGVRNVIIDGKYEVESVLSDLRRQYIAEVRYAGG